MSSESKDEESKEGSSEVTEEEAEDVLSKVQTFCMSSDFEGQFDEFARSHASAFMPAVDMKPGDEHPMELYACYEEYLSHFEGKLHNYIESECASSVEDFYDAAHGVLDSLSPFHPKRFFIEALLATTEYQVFFSLMVGEVRKMHPDHRPDGGGGEDEEDHVVDRLGEEEVEETKS
mmetsp:Transcript_2984/g.5712  ORF Transcript_2984/g.5712 Transcript_2984/m.5712 type:complete len:176 (-) Transcript_2984:20-547(-)